MQKYFFCFCLVFSLNSCGNHRLQRELEELTSREIVVPNGIRQVVVNRDTVLLNPSVREARFVMWVDSVACSTCQVSNMFEYDEIIRFHREVGNEFVPVFVLSPPRAKIREVILNLEISQFDYPVFIDENHENDPANSCDVCPVSVLLCPINFGQGVALAGENRAEPEKALACYSGNLEMKQTLKPS